MGRGQAMLGLTLPPALSLQPLDKRPTTSGASRNQRLQEMLGATWWHNFTDVSTATQDGVGPLRSHTFDTKRRYLHRTHLALHGNTMAAPLEDSNIAIELGL